jgi:hypothetical protein
MAVTCDEICSGAGHCYGTGIGDCGYRHLAVIVVFLYKKQTMPVTWGDIYSSVGECGICSGAGTLRRHRYWRLRHWHLADIVVFLYKKQSMPVTWGDIYSSVGDCGICTSVGDCGFCTSVGRLRRRSLGAAWHGGGRFEECGLAFLVVFL